jgi:fluoroquinolone resistance protein
MEYDTQTFKNERFSKERIQSEEYYDCIFTNCTFIETVFQDCIFRDCHFKGCDLSLAQFPSTSFANTLFESSKVIGVNWCEAKWNTRGSRVKKSINFVDCVLNYSVFMGLNLERILLRNCVAKEVNFEETNLTGADCTSTDFSASRFAHTNLSEADFTRASNYSIRVDENVIHQAKFSLPEAISLLYSLDIVLEEWP